LVENKEIIMQELQEVVGSKYVRCDETEISIYTRTMGRLEDLGLRIRGMPVTAKADFVIYPENAKQVSEILKIANKHKIPVVPYGGGSAVFTGSVVPVYGGIVLETKRMDKVKYIDEDSLVVTAEAGIELFKLEEELNKRGFTHGHFGGGFYCTTLGGGIATNGAGRLSPKYGKIGDAVVGLEVVLPNGEIIRTLHVPHHSTGPELSRLFIGSEGILGVITEATIKIYPLPEERLFMSFLFPSVRNAFRAARMIIKQGLKPSLLRVHDENGWAFAPEFRYMRKELSLPEEKGSIMLLMFEGPSEIVKASERVTSAICKREEGKDLGGEPAKFWLDHAWWYFYPRRGPRPFWYGVVETATLFRNHEKLYFALKETLQSKYKDMIIMCDSTHHWHTGASLYFRMLLEKAPGNKSPIEVAEDIEDTAFRLFFKYGGTVSHHHNVGVRFAKYLPEQYGPAYQLLVALKKTLDPNNIMNPGKLVVI